MPALNHILHATDFTEHADAAFDLAWSLANSLGAKLTILHVTKPPALINCDALGTPGGDPGQPAEVWDQLRSRQVSRIENCHRPQTCSCPNRSGDRDCQSRGGAGI
ncbi:MAG TPA: universal stress protein [Gemmataceae bacterium]|nr:universal stress protein [Gemmataceae bacterium]